MTTPDTVPSRPRKRVLLLEDDPVWQPLLVRILHRIDRNIDVVVSSEAGQAFGIIRDKGPFDFVIADYQLDGARTGLDLWDILLEQDLRIPFILISGRTREEFLADLRGYRIGMIPSYIEKTTSLETLQERLFSALSPELGGGRSSAPVSPVVPPTDRSWIRAALWIAFLAPGLTGTASSRPWLSPVPGSGAVSGPDLQKRTATRIADVFPPELLGDLRLLAFDRSLIRAVDRP